MRRFKALVTHAVFGTTAVNFLSLACVTISGIVLARVLGEAGRGHYAGIVAWYGVGLTLGEIGQSAALTYFTARHPAAILKNVRLSRRIMLVPSLVVLILGVALAPTFSGGDAPVLMAYAVISLAVPLNGILAPYFYSFQGFRISVWNFLRIVQPVTNMLAVGVLSALGQMSLIRAVLCLVGSAATQLAVGAVVFSRSHAVLAADEGSAADHLLGFGIRQAGSAVPSIVAQNLDRLYLSQAVAAAELGHYAIAQSVLSVASPISNAIASVAFPSFAARTGSLGRKKAELRAVLFAVAGVTPGVVLLAFVSPRLIPIIFGANYVPAVPLVIWIAPAVVAQSVVVVMTALLRGRGRPGLASIAQTATLAFATLAMTVAVPRLGVAGAAVGSLVASALGIAMMSVMLFGTSAKPREDRSA